MKGVNVPAAKGNARTSAKGAGGGATGIPARGAGNRQAQRGRVVAANAGKGTTGGKASTVKGTGTKGRGAKGTQGKR